MKHLKDFNLVYEFDVIIIGSGGAGLYAALEAGQKARTAVFSKLYPVRSHTGTAQGGISAALGNVEEDRPEWHAFDTVKGGDYLADQAAALLMAEEAVQAVYDLENMGLPFNRTPEGKIDQRRFGGHTRGFGEAPVKRACYSSDRTGHMILQTLYQQCIKNNVHFYNEFQVVDLLMENRKCGGVVAIDISTGIIHIFSSKAVLFATGGFGRMYRITSNAYASTGDGPAILARKGLPLEDMEFFQFHPTGIKGLGILITEAVRGEGGILKNGRGERFMEKYAPGLLDLAPRDMISRAIMTEVKNGNGIRGDKKIDDYVHLDATLLGKEALETKLPDISDFCRTYLGIDTSKDPIPVLPTAHYAMGGIPTDTNCRVLIDKDGNICEGLYAAGECACVSVHGANRLGTNSLLDLIVFGKRAGKHIVEIIDDITPLPIRKDAADETIRWTKEIKGKGKAIKCGYLLDEMQAIMTENAGIYRNGNDMNIAIDKLIELREKFKDIRINDDNRIFNTELLEVIELRNLLDLAFITVSSAENRTESRGAHSRIDFPDRDDKNWLKHSLIFLEGKKVRIEYKPVDISIWEPKARVY